MEILEATYVTIGFLFGMERLSRVTEGDESGMVNIGIMVIVLLWPLYIVYLIWKKVRKKIDNK